MIDKEIIEKVDNLHFDDKLKLWLGYVADMVVLNNDYKILDGNTNNGTYYPKLNLTIWKYMEGINRHNIEPFDSWITQKENYHDLTGIYAYYRKINVYSKVKWNRYEDKNSIPKYKSVIVQPIQKVSSAHSGCGCKNK